jgi:glucose-1-phosphate thymidylyltransferase
MRGIIVASGVGSQLRPATCYISKYLLPVYDKPMIHYALATLMVSDIREILVVSAPGHLEGHRRLLGDGGDLGLHIEHAVQPASHGPADALVLGGDFIGDQPVCLIHGDNIFHGAGLGQLLRAEADQVGGCTLFGYPGVINAGRYPAAEIDDSGRLRRILARATSRSTNQTVTGLYLYTPDVVRYARDLPLSGSGRRELIAVHNRYLEAGRCRLVRLGRGTAWLETSTHDSLLAASNFVQIMEQRNGERVACLEEIAWRMGFIDTPALVRLAYDHGGDTSIGRYLKGLVPAAELAAVGSEANGRTA